MDGRLWLVLVALALFSATQDIAIDAYTIELLDPAEMGPANGIRVTAYRVALIAAGGLFVALAGLIGWSAAFAGAAALMGVSCLCAVRMPAVATRPGPSGSAPWRRPGR